MSNLSEMEDAPGEGNTYAAGMSAEIRVFVGVQAERARIIPRAFEKTPKGA
jgi:hypothetical protein